MRPSRQLTWVALTLPLLLYAAAVNPYLRPGVYDNVIYYYGALSLAQNGSFAYNGAYISDWGPVLSLLLATPMLFGLTGVWISKVMILLTVFLGCVAVYRCLRKEGRSYPLVTTVLFALSPVAYSSGTMVMKEWLYLAVSFLFLTLLAHKSRPEQQVRDGLVLGVLLAVASLTWYIGVFLGTAVITKALINIRGRKEGGLLSGVKREVIAAAFGAAIFLGWRFKLALQVTVGTADSYYFAPDSLLALLLNGFKDFSLAGQAGQVTDTVFMASKIAGRIGVGGVLIDIFSLGVCLLIGWGAVSGVRARGVRPSDGYVVGIIALSFLYYAKAPRYILPVAPFLISYIITGAISLKEMMPQLKVPRAAGAVVVAGWLAFYVALDGYLLLRGNPGGTHNGLCWVLSRTPEDFYNGYWRDLYLVSTKMKDDPEPGAVAVVGGNQKYIQHFSQRRAVEPDPGESFRFLLVEPSDEVREPLALERNATLVKSVGSIELYQIGPTAQ